MGIWFFSLIFGRIYYFCSSCLLLLRQKDVLLGTTTTTGLFLKVSLSMTVLYLTVKIGSGLCHFFNSYSGKALTDTHCEYYCHTAKPFEKVFRKYAYIFLHHHLRYQFCG